MATLKFQGEEVELSTKLRVAFKIEKAHNHKPYMEVFKNVGTLSLEKQIEILWLAFKEENPEKALVLNIAKFQDELLDTSNLSYILEALTGVIEGIMYHGMTEEEIEEKKMQNLEEPTLHGRRFSDADTE